MVSPTFNPVTAALTYKVRLGDLAKWVLWSTFWVKFEMDSMIACYLIEIDPVGVTNIVALW